MLMTNGRKRLGLLVTVLVMAGVAAAPIFAASHHGQSTIGDLLVGIAGAKSLRATDATTAEAALRAAGYDLPRLDRSKGLTEGDVAMIANAVGLRVASSNPTRSFSRLQVDRFLTSMGSELTGIRSRFAAGKGDGGNANKDDSSRSGRKPRSKSPKRR